MAKHARLFCAIVLIALPCCGIALAGHGAEPEAEAAASGGGLFSGTFGEVLSGQPAGRRVFRDHGLYDQALGLGCRFADAICAEAIEEKAQARPTLI